MLEPGGCTWEAYAGVLNVPGPDEVTPIFSAVMGRDAPVAEALAMAGANPLQLQPPGVHRSEWGGWTAMQYVLKRWPEPTLFRALLSYPELTFEDVQEVRADISQALKASPREERSYREMLNETELLGERRGWPEFSPSTSVSTGRRT
jgi:hypothetical protein